MMLVMMMVRVRDRGESCTRCREGRGRMAAEVVRTHNVTIPVTTVLDAAVGVETGGGLAHDVLIKRG
jgi:uncharacterized protein (DUF362 family)